MLIRARDSIYTDSNDDTASRDGHAIKAGHTVQEKINAYSAIALGIIGFTIFFCYYLTPLVKAHRKSKVVKKRQELLKALSVTQRMSYDLGDDEPKVSKHHATPERILARDSIGVTKDRQAAYTIDLNPFLLKFPSPPDARAIPTDMQDHSPTFECKLGDDVLSCPVPTYITPPQTYSPMPPAYSLPHPSSFVGLPSMHSFSPTFVISDSEDSISGSKTKQSPSNSVLRGAQGGLKVNSVSPPALLSPTTPSTNRVCGTVPPRSSSLNALLASCSFNSSKSIKNQKDDFEGALQRTDGVNVNRTSEPIYADDILPRYLRESAETSIPANNLGPQVALPIATAATSTYSPESNITSMPIQESIFTRAARGLIGGSPPRSGEATGNELKFEMSHFF